MKNAVLSPERVLYGLTPLLWDPEVGISTQLVAELKLAGFPELQDGKILFGESALRQRRSPPSIVCMWASSATGGTEWGTEIPRPTSVFVQPVMNALATDLLQLDFHVWAAAFPPDPESIRDAYACRYLVHQLWRVIHRKAEGAYRVVGVDTNLARPSEEGFSAVMRVELRTSVPDSLLSYVLPGTKGTTSVTADGFTNEAIVFSTPGVT